MKRDVAAARPDTAVEAACWRSTAALTATTSAFAVVGGLLLLAVAQHRVPLWAALALHAVMTAGAAGLAHRATNLRTARALWLLTVSYAGLGPMGALGTLLALLLGVHFDRRATSIEDWRQALFPDEPPDEDAALWALVGSRHGERISAVAPFADILDHGTLQQKQAVVALMARHFRPAFAPALRMALRDPQNAVRVQAATAVSLIEAQATARALDLERQRQEGASDAGLLLELARHEDSYAFTGLLDAAREREARSRAVAAYRAYLDERPDDTEAAHEFGRLLARLGRHAEALACFEDLERRHASAETRLWVMECLFHLARFDDLRRMAAASRDLFRSTPESLPPETPHVLRLWAAHGARP